MSSISSVGTSLFSFLQNITPASSSQPTAAPNSSTSTTGSASTNVIDITPQKTQGGGHHHHGGGGFMKKLEQSITSALQAAQANAQTGTQSTTATGPTNPNQTIQDTLAKLFQNVFTAPTAQTPNSDPNSATSAQPIIAPAGDEDGTGNSDLESAGSADTGGNNRQAFVQTLQSFGVDPQQFFQDFQSAIQNAQGGGQIDPSTAFASFPPGSLVDTLA